MYPYYLTGLSEKIFLDRYALKNPDPSTAKIGDVVLVLTKDDPKFPAKQVGEVVQRTGNQVRVKLRNEEIIETDIQNLTLTVETRPDEMWDRLARELASVEQTPTQVAEWTEKFRWLLEDWKLVPGGRIAAGAGVTDELTLFNCYVIPSPKDSRGGIMKTLSEMTEIMARGGGVGINLSSLRPRRALVKGVNGSSSGAVSWGGLFSYTTGLIEQGGSRRGALMLMLNDWHPDIEDFITVKQKMEQVTNANLSVCISNDFMQAIKDDADWDLVFPDTEDPQYDQLWDGDLNKWKKQGKRVIHSRTVRARSVWRLIIEGAWKSAEPGVVFMEYYNQMSNSWYFNPIICTNPCGEQGLPGWGVCTLSAINLAKVYDEQAHDVNWTLLAKVIRYGLRFLDNVIDKTPYHFPENEDNQKKERRIGLGTMGLAELLIRLEIRYGSKESLDFLDKLYRFIARESYLASAEIAGEKGSFIAFEAEAYLKSGFMQNLVRTFPEVEKAITDTGMRNVTVLTQAPTGSTGTMVGTSTGIEPYFAFEFFRQSRLGLDKQMVPIAQQWQKKHPNENLPDYFVGAMDLTAEDHVRVQAAIQRWVDSSISKTANCPADFTIEQTEKLYELAFELGCKGVTIYRDGSRDTQVLSTEKEEQTKSDSSTAPIVPPAVDKGYKSRPKILCGATYKYNTPFGMAYITVNDIEGKPGEIFLNVGKAGSDVFAMAEALGRVCSLFLRYGDHGNEVKLLVKHLKGIGGTGAVGFGPNRVESIADAVAQALETHVQLSQQKYQQEVPDPASEHKKSELEYEARDLCPSCGSASLTNTEGCKMCMNCGYSKCS